MVIGGLGTVGVDKVNKLTSTDEFCTTCHSMQAYIAEDRVFQNAPHQNPTSGVRASCGDCHITGDNIITETWQHATAGIKDIYAKYAYDYEDPEVWQARRPHMAYSVRDWMAETDSAACRSCHEADRIEPTAGEGRTAHEEMVATGEKTCIQCHFNLVHDPVEPRLEFIRKRNTM